MKNINVALLGFGTVGSGVAETIRKNGKIMEDSIGCRFTISHVLVRHPEKYQNMDLLEGIHLTSSFDDIIADDSIDIIIEVMGGIHPAKEYIFEALNHHINVVSANKDLVALFGPEIMHTAMENHVNFSCEASVGGGIPILRPLHDSLAANEIESIVGIVNGTTNFILSNMDDAGVSYGDALRVAQKKGYAEADPTNDVAGYDAARKLAILASIGFHANVTFDDVLVEGIEKISQNDVQYASEMGYTIKLLAVAIRQENGIALNVYPAFVPRNHPLASVKGSYNAIYVTGNIVDDVMFYGKGAGKLPTASAVVADVVDALKHGAKVHDSLFWQPAEPVDGMLTDPTPAAYYVRVAGIAPAVAEAIYGYGKVVDERYDGCSYFVERADEKALAEAARKVEAMGGSVKLVLKRLPEEA